MDTDLVHTSSARSALDECKIQNSKFKILFCLKCCLGRKTFFIYDNFRFVFSILVETEKGRIDDSFSWVGGSVGECEIGFFDSPFFELLGEMFECAFAFGYEDDS